MAKLSIDLCITSCLIETDILAKKSMRMDRILIKAMRPGYTPLWTVCRGSCQQVVEPSYADHEVKVSRRVSRRIIIVFPFLSSGSMLTFPIGPKRLCLSPTSQGTYFKSVCIIYSIPSELLVSTIWRHWMNSLIYIPFQYYIKIYSLTKLSLVSY